MNIKTFYMTIIMTLVQTVSFESISSGEVPNFNEKENSFKNCQPWSVRYSKLEQASSQNLVITARHRGDFNKETPENSLGAFLNSYERCRPSVETDLRLTKDGKVVLFHDLNVGKMTNPNYEPETNKGDNKELKELTLSELKNLHLVTINRKLTNWTIPTLEEFLEHYVTNDPGTLVFLEVKEPAAINKVINTVKDFDNKYPDKKLHDRLIVKFNIALYPTPDKWVEAARISGGDRISLMANPVMSPYAAETLNKGEEIPEPEHKYNTNAEKSIYLWSKSEFHTAPVIEVVLKDSTEFITKTRKKNEFGEFETPATLSETNAKDGTLAKMITIVKGNNKSLGVFVPIPDYNMWRDKLVTGYTVNNTFGDKEPILVDNAFFNNDSTCCYALKDRRQKTSVASEINDWRMNIEWQKSIGANLFTADDTDSIDYYFDTGEGERPSPYMNSILSWTLKFVTHPVGTIVKMLAWNGSIVDWPWGAIGGSNVCLYLESHGSPSYGLVDHCDDSQAAAEGYNQYITLRNSTLFENKMEIYNYETNKCLIIPNNTSDWATMNNCNNENTSQIVRYSDNRYKNQNGSLYLTFKFYGLWYGSSYGYAYSETRDTAIKDNWSQWLMMEY
ncbi:glycerophosphodiester phosphodiesterase family protein [Salmonella enterica]|nr:hypothetical protein [Salmonella enterica]ECC3883437.1 hypothetical protein [Salmonella enterica subsp. diarizonae]EIE2749535.1 glycerophosphodiester phosphodiesterase family protein [Salmonella enterica subsp. diarizonae serovar 48:i:z]ECJ4780230.1 hypothetical protein [Salmonella enterica subsp. diarizonae]EDQ7408551.1 glycerophosphodiester phosphodiesterase family protein [Salmonella enterica subsp. diarizonae]